MDDEDAGAAEAPASSRAAGDHEPGPGEVDIVGATDGPVAESRPASIKAVPVRHPGRWVVGVIILVVGAQLANWFLTNKPLGFATARSYLFDHSILLGVWVTLELTFIAMVMGVAIGIVVAIMRLSNNVLVSAAAWVYTWFFRGTPVLVQLLFWYNLPTVAN